MEPCPVGTSERKGMAEIDFADVDILWKSYNFAVYGGVRR